MNPEMQEYGPGSSAEMVSSSSSSFRGGDQEIVRRTHPEPVVAQKEHNRVVTSCTLQSSQQHTSELGLEKVRVLDPHLPRREGEAGTEREGASTEPRTVIDITDSTQDSADSKKNSRHVGSQGSSGMQTAERPAGPKINKKVTAGVRNPVGNFVGAVT